MASPILQLPHVRCGRPDSALTILQLTDLHQWPRGYHEFHKPDGTVINLVEAGYDTNKNVKLINRICDRSPPDLVVLTGDIIDSRPLEKHGDWKETFMAVIQPLIDRGIQWTFVPGNHDHDGPESPFSRDDLKQIYSFPLCATQNATSFNFTFTAGPTDSFDASSSVRLWCLDSGVNHPEFRYTTFDPVVVKAFVDLSSTLPECTTSLAYFHIPLPEYAGLDPVVGVNGLFNSALNAGKVPLPWSMVPWLVRLMKKDRIVGSSTENSGLFEAIRDDGKVIATFCGHDHSSDAVFKRDGVYLCYGRCGSFTPPSDWEKAAGDPPFDMGARLVGVYKRRPSDPAVVSTWVETMDGKVDDSICLLKR